MEHSVGATKLHVRTQSGPYVRGVTGEHGHLVDCSQATSYTMVSRVQSIASGSEQMRRRISVKSLSRKSEHVAIAATLVGFGRMILMVKINTVVCRMLL